MVTSSPLWSPPGLSTSVLMEENLCAPLALGAHSTGLSGGTSPKYSLLFYSWFFIDPSEYKSVQVKLCLSLAPRYIGGPSCFLCLFVCFFLVWFKKIVISPIYHLYYYYYFLRIFLRESERAQAGVVGGGRENLRQILHGVQSPTRGSRSHDPEIVM